MIVETTGNALQASLEMPIILGGRRLDRLGEDMSRRGDEDPEDSKGTSCVRLDGQVAQSEQDPFVGFQRMWNIDSAS